MNRPEKYIDKPISPEEIEEVFGWILTNEECFLVERVAPVAKTTSGIILPQNIRSSRQTGSTAGHIIQIGAVALEKFNEKLERTGRQVEVGGMVTFSYAAPVDIGLIDEQGMPMLSGSSDSPYAGLALIHHSDVLGYYVKRNKGNNAHSE